MWKDGEYSSFLASAGDKPVLSVLDLRRPGARCSPALPPRGFGGGERSSATFGVPCLQNVIVGDVAFNAIEDFHHLGPADLGLEVGAGSCDLQGRDGG